MQSVSQRTERSIVALVDLSSLNPKIRIQADVDDALHLLRTLVRSAVASFGCPPDVADVDVRFYGGFLAHDGMATAQLSFLRKAIREFEGFDDGVRFRAMPVLALACRPSAKITGTYRDSRQRMVDQMLAQDALHFSEAYDMLLIVADDEDYFPAMLALAASREGSPVRWLRKRTSGRNDAHLESTRIQTLVDPAWRAG